MFDGHVWSVHFTLKYICFWIKQTYLFELAEKLSKYFHSSFQMSNIFNLENVNDFAEKLNIDDLYEKKHQHDLNQLALFNKVLNRIHVRIKTISRQRKDEQFCWFVVPEMIIGVPRYDQANCIAYLISKLKDNGFNVRYIHPNTLFISWLHWVPSYVRKELKSKTGIEINEFGQKISDVDEDNVNVNEAMMSSAESTAKPTKQPPKREYTPITSYKPSGNLIYDNDLFNKIEDKFM
jgi:hypothetical protein